MSQLFFAQKAFIVSDQSVLLVRKSADDPNQPGLWEVPGGRMQFGENINDHLRREVFEEVGLDVTPGDPFHVWEWRLSRQTKDGPVDWQIVAVARICHTLSLETSASHRVAEDYLAETVWVPFGELLAIDFIPNMRPVVESFLKKHGQGTLSDAKF
jgi:8-oxo-dGTP pyrophosphatase MutT (NUDIX family)